MAQGAGCFALLPSERSLTEAALAGGLRVTASECPGVTIKPPAGQGAPHRCRASAALEDLAHTLETVELDSTTRDPNAFAGTVGGAAHMPPVDPCRSDGCAARATLAGLAVAVESIQKESFR